MKRQPLSQLSQRSRPCRKSLFRAIESLESRWLLSGSNAIDRLDFGNLAQEAAHNFDPGITPTKLPLRGTGTVGASAGLNYRNATDGSGLTFTLAVDPNHQDYFTVRFWGNDANATVTLDDGTGTAISQMEESGGPVVFPNRFYYYTYAIPENLTLGKSAVQLHLDIDAPGKPVYSVYTTTDPDFVPDSNDAPGTKPTATGQATLTTLTATQAINILLANRKSIYNSGKYFDTVLARQAIVLNGNGTWSAPTGAPKEVAGLDLFTNLASWMAANPSATADQWRQQIAHTQNQPGYTAFPDELLTILTSSYLLQPLTDANGNAVTGQGTLDHYHDSTLITRIVAAIDGASYEQDSDGGFIQQGASAAANSAWTGLTSTARTVGNFTGSTARQSTVHGGGDLQGVDTYALGWSIIQLLNDPTAAPLLQSYLGQSYDADLNGGSTLRATAWERMLYNAVQFYQSATGGTETQNMFQELGMYAEDIALQKLQALFPNSTYPANEPTALRYVKELMGLIPDTDMRGIGFGDTSPFATPPTANYGLTSQGFGEAHGALSTGFDGGGYGQIIPWLAPRVAILATWDTSADAATVNAIKSIANKTINSFDQFLSPLDNATVNSSGVVTNDAYGFAEETYITYRDTKNPNFEANRFNFNPQFLASDPTGILANSYTLRSAYLTTQYGLTVSTTSDSDHDTSGGGALNNLRDLSAYESTIRSLINVNPTTLTPLPAEPGQPDFAFADVQGGAVAIVNHGDRLYLSLNFRNYESNNNSFANLLPDQILRYHYTTSTIERGGEVKLPHDATTVQSDGNLSATSLNGVDVARLGDYLIVLNNSTNAYPAKLPVGIGLAQDLITHNIYSLSSNGSSPATVNVAAGHAAIFWLNAATVIPSLSIGVDIGNVGKTGSDSYANSIYTILGAGADIGGTLDAFHFVPTSINGNATIVAQVLSQSNTNNLAQAGVMIRDGTTTTGAFAAVVRTPGGGVRFEYRTSAGGSVAWVAAPTPLSPVYVKLTRSGNAISGYYSVDGTNWTQIGSTQSIALPTSAFAGLAVSSHDVTTLSTATFGNVAVYSNVEPTIATPATASATTVTTNAVNLSVLGADDSGESNLAYSWTLIGTPPDAVSYSANGTNAAKNTAATFAAAGIYTFRVFIRDASGAFVTSDVTVTVVQTPTGLSITPSAVVLSNNGTKSFYAAQADQFGMPLQHPSTVVWSIDSGGIGAIDQTGLYAAPASGSGNPIVRATVGTLSATAIVVVQSMGIFNAQQDIGATTPAGSASFNGSTSVYTVSGSGTDVWTTADQFHYVYLPLTGDVTITARVATETNTNVSTKSGIMLRNTLDANSAYAFLFSTPTITSGVEYQYRSSAGASAAQNAGASGSGTAPPQWLRIVRSGNSFTAYRSTDGTTWTIFGTAQTISMNATIYVGLAVCSHSSGTLATATFDNVALTQPALTFPAYSDIGSPSPAGSYSESAGVVTMTGGGLDIYTTADQFTMAYVPITGNATITARVVSLANTNTNAKAGVMIRSTLAAGSQEVSSLVTATNGINLDYRSATNGASAETKITGLAAPYWVRVIRSGNSFSAWRSVDGVTWTQTGATQTIAMNATAYVGLAVCSHNNGTATTAVFDNISYTGTVAANAAPTIATPPAAAINPVVGTTANLSVLGADDGGESNLTYAWDLVNLPPGNVTFSANGTNAAKNTTATFSKAGTYIFRVTITDGSGASVSGLLNVTVNQILTSITVSPATTSLSPGATRQFSAAALDQFGQPMTSQPSFMWSVSSGVGTIDSAGLYTAPLSGSSATIQATSGGKNGSATVSITNQSPLIATSDGAAAGATAVVGTTISLSVPAVDDSGNANLIYLWSAINPPGPVAFGDNGTTTASSTTATFTQPGTYTFQVAVTDPGDLSTSSMLTFINVIGDANRDDIVNITDFNALAANFGMNGRTWSQGDFNGDGIVNLLDLNAIATNFGQGVAAPSSQAASVQAAQTISLFSDKSIDVQNLSVDVLGQSA